MTLFATLIGGVFIGIRYERNKSVSSDETVSLLEAERLKRWKEIQGLRGSLRRSSQQVDSSEYSDAMEIEFAHLELQRKQAVLDNIQRRILELESSR